MKTQLCSILSAAIDWRRSTGRGTGAILPNFRPGQLANHVTPERWHDGLEQCATGRDLHGANRFIGCAGGSNWVDHINIPTTNAVIHQSAHGFQPRPPARAGSGGFTSRWGTVSDSCISSSPIPLTWAFIVSAFYMDSNSVTYGLWLSVYNWATNHGYHFDDAGQGKASNNPVQTVNWYDCVKWCNARAVAGLTPCYYTGSSQTTVYRTERRGPRQFLGEVDGQWLPSADRGRSGRRRRGAAWSGNGFRETPSARAGANYQGDTAGYVYVGPDRLQPRWRHRGGGYYTCPVSARLRRMAMGSMTRRATFMIGVGIGMRRRMREEPIRSVQPQARPAPFVAAVLPSPRTTTARRPAAISPRQLSATVSGFGV